MGLPLAEFLIGDLEADDRLADRLGTGRPFGDSHKVKLDKKHSKTNGVKQSKKAFGLWVPPSRPFKCSSASHYLRQNWEARRHRRTH